MAIERHAYRGFADAANQHIPVGAIDWLTEVNKLILIHEHCDQPIHPSELPLGDVMYNHWDGVRFETVIADARPKRFVDRQHLPSVDPRTRAPNEFAEELIRTIGAFRKRLR